MVENQIRERIGVVREDPSKAGASGPVGGGLAIEAGAGLVGRVPGAAGVGQRKAANVAGDLFALERRESVKARTRDDAGVGEIEILEVAAVLRVAVGASGFDGRAV